MGTGRPGERNPSEGAPHRSAGRSRFDVAPLDVIIRGSRLPIIHTRASMSDVLTPQPGKLSLSTLALRIGVPALFLSGVPAGLAAQQAGSPYADMRDREIKALSQDEIDGLLTGEGMGYALPAELNGYPGPRHVLDLAGELALTDRQRNEVQDVFGRMRAAAVDLGERLVAVERALERAFVSDEATPDRVDRLTREAADLEGRLRAVHLGAHVETKDLLTDEQVEAYERLRGYHGEHRHGGHER